MLVVKSGVEKMWCRSSSVLGGICITTICLLMSSCAGAVGGRTDGITIAVSRQPVVLTAPVEVGWAGWCVSVRGVELSGSCPDLRSHGSILAERWGREADGRIVDIAITDGSVMTVDLANGTAVPTRTEAGLPGGVRVAVVEVTSGSTAAIESVIAHGFAVVAVSGDNSTRAGAMGYEVRGEGWHEPAAPLRGDCAIYMTRSERIYDAIRGGVVSEARAYPGLFGNGFFTCVDVEYAFNAGRASLVAGLLVNAQDPGGRPGPLPVMKKLAGYRGIYEVPSENGVMLLKRIGGAWLFVANGPLTKADASVTQRLALLTALQGEVDL